MLETSIHNNNNSNISNISNDMSAAAEVATMSESTSLAVVSPSDDTRTSTASIVAPSPRSNCSSTIVPTDQDVLCGRGKGIRKHPGNELYNKLLRDNYDEYKAAPKGSKVSIVKKIVSLVRERGRFLERSTQNGKWVYADIGDDRAVNKTVRIFIRSVGATVALGRILMFCLFQLHRPRHCGTFG